ncbi:MAG: hypothetical protein J5849_00755 [Clostridia bacterium]|nr:hypothetical protein [Clostridia bacterium]
MRRNLPLSFRVGFAHSPSAVPEETVPAAVPGNAQLDWANAHGYPPYIYADNFKMFSWMEDVFWIYRAEIPAADLAEDERVFFTAPGIDYEFKIFADGDELLYQEGMFTPVDLDVTDYARKGFSLTVAVYPAPKIPGRPADRTQAAQSVKPPVSYGWDWHPRLIPSGLYEETRLEVRPDAFIRSFETLYTLSDGYTKANLRVSCDLSRARGEILWRLLDKNGGPVLEKRLPAEKENRIDAELNDVELWWPNEQGEQVLYTSVCSLLDEEGRLLDEKSRRVGFKDVELKMHPRAGIDCETFPKGRNHAPIQMSVNGRRIFCKGSNWVHPDIFMGRVGRETYEKEIRLAKEAHFNLFRVWGGGVVNKESFFDLCDEMGVMVWQEFPLACNNYEGTPRYLKILDQESQSIIRRLRGHVSLAIWCGGNELFNDWSGMDDQSLALRLLASNCFRMDPMRPYMNTSPLYGMAHGNYVFRYPDGRDVYSVMPERHNSAYTEFGSPGMSDVEVLKTIIPPDELFPPQPGGAYEAHHAFGAWAGDTWLCPSTAEYYFGKAESLEELVRETQFLQSRGYVAIFEEARRQWPVCSMSLNWCYNEPWPSAANNNLISWGGRPKPAYYAVKESCRPQMASARVRKFLFGPGDVFSAELFLLNDLPRAIGPATVTAYLELPDGRRELCLWHAPAVAGTSNLRGPDAVFVLGDYDDCTLKLTLEVEEKPEFGSVYEFLYRNPGRRKDKKASPALNQ